MCSLDKTGDQLKVWRVETITIIKSYIAAIETGLSHGQSLQTSNILSGIQNIYFCFVFYKCFFSSFSCFQSGWRISGKCIEQLKQEPFHPEDYIDSLISKYIQDHWLLKLGRKLPKLSLFCSRLLKIKTWSKLLQEMSLGQGRE